VSSVDGGGREGVLLKKTKESEDVKERDKRVRELRARER